MALHDMNQYIAKIFMYFNVFIKIYNFEEQYVDLKA